MVTVGLQGFSFHPQTVHLVEGSVLACSEKVSSAGCLSTWTRIEPLDVTNDGTQWIKTDL